MTRLIDPVHFFDQRGCSTLSFDHVLEQLKKVEEENVRLKRMLRAVQKRDAILEDEKSPGSFQ